MHEAAMSNRDLQLGWLRHDRRVDWPTLGGRGGTNACELLVRDGGESDVPAETAAAGLDCREHAGGQAPLHVVGAAAVQASTRQPWNEGVGHPRHSDGVHVGVQHQGASAAGAARDGDHVRPPRRSLLDAHLEPRALAPFGDEAREAQLTRSAGNDVRVDGLDLDEPGSQLRDVAHAVNAASASSSAA